MRVVCGLGNPGEEYASTRHNVGWWAVEEARRRWRFPGFVRDGRARVSSGTVGGESVRLLRPITFMNRSGAVLGALRGDPSFDIAHDLLVVVDDTALDVGRLRIRAGGSAGGHNGLKSVEAALGTQEYARLRIGVGAPPPGMDQADWVLESFGKADEEEVRARLGDVVDAIELWLAEGVEAAANRFNR